MYVYVVMYRFSIMSPGCELRYLVAAAFRAYKLLESTFYVAVAAKHFLTRFSEHSIFFLCCNTLLQ